MSFSFISNLAQKETSNSDQDLLVFEDKAYSFSYFSRCVRHFAYHLVHFHHVEKNSHVAVIAHNSIENAILIYALARIGAVWVPVNAEQRGKALEYILDDSHPFLVISDQDLVELIKPVRPEHASIVSLQAFAEEVGISGNADEPSNSEGWDYPLPEASDLLAIMYTSGTTGPPKGVGVTHEMMRYAIEGVKKLTSIDTGDVFFQWEPFYHIAGAQMLFLPMLGDVKTYIVKRFSASRFWLQVSRAKATHIHYLGGVLDILLKRPTSEFHACDRLRIAWGGGCSRNIWKTVKETFNVEVRECYGMTEASSLTTVNIGGPAGSVGRPLPWVDVNVVDRTGAEVAAGVAGEIVIRQKEPGVLFNGYINKEEATREVLSENSFKTGDRGWLDDVGHLYFAGRLNDSVRHRGENVSSWEVESAVMEHPEVKAVAMVGVEAEIGEQDIHLYVQKKGEAHFSERDLHEWMRGRLARYQLPRYITFVKDFPRTPSQRIKKKLLKKGTGEVWRSD